MREIGMAWIGGIKGRVWQPFPSDKRDFRDERDRDGRGKSDKRESVVAIGRSSCKA